jgi:hypothetical protein
MRITHCYNERCTFAVEQLGVGVSLISELKNHPEVMEVLISLAYASASVSEKRDTFHPMCPISVEDLRSTIPFQGPGSFFLENKEKNFPFVKQLLQQIPSVDKLLDLSEGGQDVVLQRKLSSLIHPLAFPFLQWIVSSNRSHLECIPAAHQIKALGSRQFLLLSSNPQREWRFRQRRAELEQRNGEGSFFAWHGSAMSNWHAILRDGLRVLSGTKLMTNGQAYGSGIYVAQSISTSLAYAPACSAEMLWKGATILNHSAGCTALALCEILSDRDVYNNHNNDIITVKDPDAICTRFLFFFPGGCSSVFGLPSNKEIATKLFQAFPDFLRQ